MTQPENPTTLNLDKLAAEHAQAIIRDTSDVKSADVENTVTKSLGVLQENGLYAFFLFLYSRSDKETPRAKVIAGQALDLLANMQFGWTLPKAGASSQDVLAHVSATMLDDLEKLLLAKQTCEQMLIYARYGAKAR